MNEIYIEGNRNNINNIREIIKHHNLRCKILVHFQSPAYRAKVIVVGHRMLFNNQEDSILFRMSYNE